MFAMHEKEILEQIQKRNCAATYGCNDLLFLPITELEDFQRMLCSKCRTLSSTLWREYKCLESRNRYNMNLPTRGTCEKRPKVEGISKFIIVDQTPLLLRQWWNEMEGHDYRG
ncbi:hypothetical protein P3L10_024547 [Capsicum annuum]